MLISLLDKLSRLKHAAVRKPEKCVILISIRLGLYLKIYEPVLCTCWACVTGLLTTRIDAHGENKWKFVLKKVLSLNKLL